MGEEDGGIGGHRGGVSFVDCTVRSSEGVPMNEEEVNKAAVKPSGRSTRSSGTATHGLLVDNRVDQHEHKKEYSQRRRDNGSDFNPASTLLQSTTHLPQFEQLLESLDLDVDDPGLGKTFYDGQTRYREVYPHIQSDGNHRNRAVTPLATNAYANSALVVRYEFLRNHDASYDTEYKLLCELGAYDVLDTLTPENSGGGTNTRVTDERYSQLGSSGTYQSGRCGKTTNNQLTQIASVLTKLVKVVITHSVDDGGLCVGRINTGSCVFFAMTARCAAQPMDNGTVASDMTIGGFGGFGGAAGRDGGPRGCCPSS